MEGYNKPYKYCIARMIVSLGLGISSSVFAISGAIFTIYELIMTFMCTFGRLVMPSAAFVLMGVVYGWIFFIAVAMFSGIGIASSIVSKKQKEKYIELYEVDSKMIKPSELTAKIGFIANIITVSVSLLCAIIVSIAMAL